MVESIQTTDQSDNKDHNSSSPEVDESFRIHSKKSILHILQDRRWIFNPSDGTDAQPVTNARAAHIPCGSDSH